MKRQLVLSSLLLALLIISSGCTPDSPLGVLFSPPVCSILKTEKIDASFPTPATIRLTVKNTGDATAYDVACEIKLKNGNTVVDEDAVYYGTLASGESYEQDAWFWKITSHGEYTSADYFLYWYDSQGIYHDSSGSAPDGQEKTGNGSSPLQKQHPTVRG